MLSVESSCTNLIAFSIHNARQYRNCYTRTKTINLWKKRTSKYCLTRVLKNVINIYNRREHVVATVFRRTYLLRLWAGAVQSITRRKIQVVCSLLHIAAKLYYIFPIYLKAKKLSLPRNKAIPSSDSIAHYDVLLAHYSYWRAIQLLE